jgi:hypothetical protein
MKIITYRSEIYESMNDNNKKQKKLKIVTTDQRTEKHLFIFSHID